MHKMCFLAQTNFLIIGKGKTLEGRLIFQQRAPEILELKVFAPDFEALEQYQQLFKELRRARDLPQVKTACIKLGYIQL